MHSYMHSSKIIKQKKIKFYAFINVFLKKINIKKTKRTHAFKHAFSFIKFTKILRIHKCILLKKKKEQYQKEKKN